MNYRGILTEEAAKGFRKEGATTAVITLYNKTTDKVIRDIELELVDLDKGMSFSISGKTSTGIAKMNDAFRGGIVNGRKWYPFKFLYKESSNTDNILKEVATAAGCEPSDLEWALIKYED